MPEGFDLARVDLLGASHGEMPPVMSLILAMREYFEGERDGDEQFLATLGMLAYYDAKVEGGAPHAEAALLCPTGRLTIQWEPKTEFLEDVGVATKYAEAVGA